MIHLQNFHTKEKILRDTAFIKMMQAILICQGAKYFGRTEEPRYIFKINYTDNKPQKLEIVQVILYICIYNWYRIYFSTSITLKS